MKTHILLLCTVALASAGAVKAGRQATNIRVSSSVPPMEATAIWMAPRIETSPASTTVAAADGALLYSEAVTFKQLAGSIGAPLTVAGARPATVPAEMLFSAWLVDGRTYACTSSAQDPARPGKAAYQLCLTARDGRPMAAAVARKLGETLDKADTMVLANPIILQREKAASTASGTPWPAANLFTYRQDGGVGIITSYGDALLSPEISYERRLVVRKATASSLTLRCEAGDRDDLSKPIAAQSPSFSKREEAEIAIGASPVAVTLCGGQFEIARNGVSLAVTVRAPFATWWSFDAPRGQFMIDGQAFAYGAPSR